MLTTAKQKECKGCGSMFQPFSSTARACSQRCAMKVVKADKQAEKQTDRATRERLKTIPQLIKEAQVEFNRFIRHRDHEQPCISCGAPPPDLSGLHAGRDAGHYRSTGAAAHLRFDENNCHAQCVHCNQHLAGNVVDYRIGLVQRIGLAEVEALEADTTPMKWDRETLRQIKTVYRAKTRQLLKEKA